MGPKTPDYKPVALRWPFLLPLFLYLCGLIAVLEFSHRTFPTANSRDNDPDELPYAPILLSAPLVNAAAHAPTPKPTPAYPTPAYPTLNVKKRQNDTDAAASPASNETDAASLASDDTDAASPDSDETDAPSPASNETDTGPTPVFDPSTYVPPPDGVWVIARGGQPPPPGAANETSTSTNATESSNSTLAGRSWHLRARVQPDAAFADFSGPTNRLFYMMQLGPRDDQYESGLHIFYENVDYEGSENHCLVTCDGPALVFHTPECYDTWGAKGAELKGWMDYRPEYDWVIQEAEYGSGKRCGDAPGAKVETRLYTWTEDDSVSTYFIMSSFAPAMTITERGPDGAPTHTAVVAATPTPSVVALVDDQGRTTGWTTVYPDYWTSIEYDAQGHPTRTVIKNPLETGRTTMTLRDSRGVPTATITGNGGPMMTTITERDAHGVPTATITAEVSHGFRLVTLTDAEGRPTATITVEPPPSYWSPKSNSSLSGSGSSSDQSLHHPLKQSEYWLAYFLPVFLTTVVAICAQVISSDIRVMLPFHNLTRDNGRGVPASQSLLIPAGVINDYVTSFRMLVRLREPLPILGDLLVLLAALVTALSGEAVGIKLYGKCGEDYFNGCFLGIAVITGPAIALKVCLCLELVVLVVIWVLLTRWRTGVASVPHTIAATASLVQDPSVRGLFRKMEVDEDDRDGPGGYVREKWILDRLRNHVFGLGRFTHPLYNTEDYGVVVREKDEVLVGLKSQGSFRSIKTSLVRRTSSFKTALARTATACRSRAPGWLISQPTTNYVSLGGLIFFGGLLLLVLYYENTHGNDGFEDFMMDQNFGARFLFTVLGILISFFWGYYAAAIAILEPYRRLAVAPQPAAYSILISPSTAAVTDVASTILAGRSGWFVSLVQASVFLSNFTPVLLSGVPFSPAQTLLAHRLSAYSAVGCLAFMLLTLLAGAIWVRYPRMPLDPASLAGRIYYVCDSIMTHDFRGTSLLEKKAFRGRVGKTKRYRFGKMIGVSGAARTGVDYDDAHLIDGEKLDDVDL